MTDTDTETLPNGTGPLSAEEEERLKQRPADIDADVREMERRKRVEALMSSKLFREELERVLDQQMHEGNDAPLLQRIREMVGGRLHTGSLRGPTCVLPINDIRGIEGVGYEKGEKILRCKLAAVYRLVDLFGWTQTGITGQITARLNTAVEQVLTTPRGLLPHEVTASALVKVDMQGVVQDQGTTNFPVNVEGFSLHACVHAARPDVRCVLHVRSPAALAVSAVRRGLLPLCHEAALLGELAYLTVCGGVLDNAERDALVRQVGPHAKVLFLSGQGALCCGATLEEAFHQARHLAAACEVQHRLAALPLDELILIDDETRHKIYEASRKPPTDTTKWRVGGEEFEALMRMLDNAGFRTGYIYRHPLIKNDVPKPKNDVEVPPAVSSLGYLLEEEELYKQGLWKKGGKTGERTRWLNSPNVYQKVEVLETGTSDPKKITKWVDANNEEWVQDGSPAHSGTPVKIDTLQFVPKNTNPKEFKALQQQIKDNRRADKISAGPQSHILEGVTWDEAAKLVGEDAVNTHTGDHVVLMGAASKGIIQRGYQHNATMYSAPYARNPFDQVSDRELDEYKRTIERKQRGNEYDTDLSESEAISAAQITSPASAPSETEEESRDEHRVLRIETKQVPIRSQPEVVLSDADTTDFLNAERAHAERTKGINRDPNLLSDDEVFVRSVSTDASRVTSPMSLTVPRFGRASDRDQSLLSDDEVFFDARRTGPVNKVVVRAQTTAVQQSVVRGTNEAKLPNEALTVNKKTKHDYNRIANFDKFLQIYERHTSDNNNIDEKRDPKCKISLSNRLSTQHVDVEPLEVAGNASSRSSLRSIASLEWDGRCKSEYAFRTRSLPRQRANSSQNLYRTRSHSGFINNYIKNPDPMHYHLPKCRSCGTINNSYVWELTRETLGRVRMPNSMYYSVDNIQQKCIDEGLFEPNLIKVKEKVLPVYKIAKQEAEFVESQEFNEDNYLGELGNSFSSENQTVIEQATAKNICVESKSEMQEVQESEIQYREEIPIVETEDINNNTIESTGEYHSFTDEMDFEEATYDSPVKNLVEKDIRDYSVPIKYYCDDYKKSCSPQKSPQKFRDNTAKATILEPILEESKTSDDLNVDNKSKENYSVLDITRNEISKESIEHDIGDNVGIQEQLQVENKVFISSVAINEKEMHGYDQTIFKDIECFNKDNLLIESKPTENTDSGSLIVETNFVSKHLVNSDIVRVSIFSNTSSAIEATSFNSTVEFEIYEIISDIVSSILNKIDFENNSFGFFDRIAQGIDQKNGNTETDMINEHNTEINLVLAQTYSNDISDESKSIEVKYKDEIYDDNCADTQEDTDCSNLGVTIVVPIINYIISTSSEEKSIEDSNKDVNMSDNSNSAMFSIKKIVEELETNINLNETVLTEASESENQTNKLIQPILYHVFDRAYGMCSDRFKKTTAKKSKRVVTIVDSEDILATAKSLWVIIEEQSNSNVFDCELNDVIRVNDMDKHAESIGAYLKTMETSFNDNTPDNCETYNLKYHSEIALKESTKVYDNAHIVNNTGNKIYEFHFEQQDIIGTVACGIIGNVCEKITFNDDCTSETPNTYDYVEFNDSSHNKTMNDWSDTTYDVAENFEENFEQKTEDEIVFNETFIMDDKDEHMNTAFVDSVDSNQNSKIVFDCNESPIKKSKGSFVGEELSVLYEKDDTLMGSPFVKKAPVITMEQIESTGGIKYWLSFDDNFKKEIEPVARTAKSVDDSLPTFICFDFDDSNLDKDAKELYFEEKRRSGVLENVSFGMNTSSLSLEYKTCESEILESKNEIDEPQKKLLYDNRIDKSRTRRYSSWPPFEDTLFYRIISQFRMSESFDPNDFNELTMSDHTFNKDPNACGDRDYNL